MIGIKISFKLDNNITSQSYQLDLVSAHEFYCMGKEGPWRWKWMFLQHAIVSSSFPAMPGRNLDLSHDFCPTFVFVKT